MAAYNIALYHEMTDDIEQALISLDMALQLAYLGSDKDIALIEQYREVLQNRKIELELLKSAQK